MTISVRLMTSSCLLSVCICSSAHAATLAVAASGQFTSGVIADPLAAPGGIWSLSFNVDSSPIAANVDALGFDAPFTDFKYTLNGTSVSIASENIRFATDANLGLFTVYFGPETGFLNGLPIPIFSFEGDQAFSGTTALPTVLAGSYPVTDVVYSDAINYDDEGSSGGPVIISASPQPPPMPPVPTPVPEPPTGLLLLIGSVALGTGVCSERWKRLRRLPTL